MDDTGKRRLLSTPCSRRADVDEWRFSPAGSPSARLFQHAGLIGDIVRPVRGMNGTGFRTAGGGRRRGRSCHDGCRIRRWSTLPAPRCCPPGQRQHLLRRHRRRVHGPPGGASTSLTAFARHGPGAIAPPSPSATGWPSRPAEPSTLADRTGSISSRTRVNPGTSDGAPGASPLHDADETGTGHIRREGRGQSPPQGPRPPATGPRSRPPRPEGQRRGERKQAHHGETGSRRFGHRGGAGRWPRSTARQGRAP